jgi:ketosteroid isomerase-like protein
MPTAATLEGFIARVEQNAHAEAIEEFYTEDATMRENMNAPRVGRSTLVAQERATLARARSVQSRCVRPLLVQGNIVVVRWVFRFEGHDGRVRELEELAWQRWQGERIAEEQFFYDPAQFVWRDPPAP